MQLSILDNAAKDIEDFNKIGLHYEIVSSWWQRSKTEPNAVLK